MNKIIEVSNLSKNYKNVKAVNDISFNVNEGEFFAFLGINGAGKSTTINILCTVLQKTSGSVKIGGFDLDKQSDKIKDLIGIVFQNSVLDTQLTVKENLISRASYYGLSKTQIKERVKYLAKIFNLDEIMNRRYGKLSGGQKRRVDIARALINEPKILFLDEPTTGLDPQTRVQVWNIIHKLRKEKGLTVFLTTHYMEETTDCDNVVIIDNGQIFANDTPNNLKNTYAQNSLFWYTEQNSNTENLLVQSNLKFEYSNSAYHIKIEKSSEATELIKKFKIEDYEVIKGNMDSVFLNITGKRLGE
ncbi:MAG: ABC transporter ATP-binding protein [Ruminococcus sp.]|nr:ABC transporter ATP-binding protein [Ruminococcus sp.]